MNQVLEDGQAVLDHQTVARFGPSIAGPHDSAELQSSINEVARGFAEEVTEEPTVVDRVECQPVFLSLDPNQQVLQHCFELRDQLSDVSLDMCSVLRPDQRVQRRQVLFDSVRHKLAISQDVVVDLLLERNDLQTRLLPFLPNCQEDCLVLGLGCRVVYDQPDVRRILLNVELFKVDDRERY